jgi:hypothetical protein
MAVIADHTANPFSADSIASSTSLRLAWHIRSITWPVAGLIVSKDSSEF